MNTRLISEREIREDLHISRSLMYKLRKDPTFPQPYKIGRALRWNPRDVAEWLKLQCL